MLVKELIEELEKFDKTLPVFTNFGQVIGVDLGVALLKEKTKPVAKIIIASENED